MNSPPTSSFKDNPPFCQGYIFIPCVCLTIGNLPGSQGRGSGCFLVARISASYQFLTQFKSVNCQLTWHNWSLRCFCGGGRAWQECDHNAVPCLQLVLIAAQDQMNMCLANLEVDFDFLQACNTKVQKIKSFSLSKTIFRIFIFSDSIKGL